MNQIKVSVIVPLFNQERYVAQCLESVLAQTLREIEVVCIDDGSTDRSLSVIRGVAKTDSRLRVITRENRGVGVTRNEGIELAKGEYVAFMDPDDYYPQNRALESLYDAAVGHSVEIVGGSLVVFDEAKGVERKKLQYPECFTEAKRVDYSDFQHDYGFQRFIYRRELLVSKRIVFPPYKRFQDPPFMIRAMIAAGSFYAIPDYVYAYRWSQRFSKWDPERAEHLALALLDDMMIAREHKLWKLFDNTLARFKIDFKTVFLENKSDALRKVQQKVMKLAVEVSVSRFAVSTVTHPSVSVVIPVYNTQEYLRECLDSLAKQSLMDMEFICVNDGSTDASLKIMREFSARDSRFKVIDKPNGGYGQSVNCGLAAARGKYVGIVEPDDFVSAEMYKTLYECAEAHQVDFVKGGIIFYWKEQPERHISICADKTLVGRILDPRYDHGIFNAVMNNVTGIYRRSFLESHQIRLNETPGAAYQDNSLYFQVHYAAKRVFLMDREFYYYRQDNENSSINSKAKAFAIFEEYRLNDAILKDDPKKRKIFLGHYLYKKFKSYKFHFDRIDPNSRLEFLQQMTEEFKVHERRGEIDWSIMSAGHQGILRSLLDDYHIYYERHKNDVPSFGANANKKMTGKKTRTPVTLAPESQCVEVDWQVAFSNWRQRELTIKSKTELRDFIYVKFKAYKDILRKVEPKSVVKLLKSVQAEFRQHEEQGVISWEKMSPGHVAILKSLLNDINDYAINVLVARLQDRACREAEIRKLQDACQKLEAACEEEHKARVKNWNERTMYVQKWREEQAKVKELTAAPAVAQKAAKRELPADEVATLRSKNSALAEEVKVQKAARVKNWNERMLYVQKWREEQAKVKELKAALAAAQKTTGDRGEIENLRAQVAALTEEVKVQKAARVKNWNERTMYVRKWREEQEKVKALQGGKKAPTASAPAAKPTVKSVAKPIGSVVAPDGVDITLLEN